MDVKSKIGPLTAVIMAIALATWMLIGGHGLTTAMAETDTATATEAPTTESPATTANSDTKWVQVETITAEIIQTQITLAGETRASESLSLQSSYSGTITRVNFKKGDRIQKGQTLITIDTRVLEANINRAQAVIEEKKLDLAAAKRLATQKLSSKISLASATSALASAEADLESLLIDLENSQTRAPFSGVLNDIHVNTGQVIQKGDPIAELITLEPLTVHTQVPQKDLRLIDLGAQAKVTTLSGITTEGEVTFIDGIADSNTRSMGVDITIENTGRALPAGVSTTVEVALKSQLAHGFSPALLTLDDNGRAAIKTVDNNNNVNLQPVNIVRFTRDKVWVSGLPESVSIITVGQGFVNAGDQVFTQAAK